MYWLTSPELFKLVGIGVLAIVFLYLLYDTCKKIVYMLSDDDDDDDFPYGIS